VTEDRPSRDSCALVTACGDVVIRRPQRRPEGARSPRPVGHGQPVAAWRRRLAGFRDGRRATSSTTGGAARSPHARSPRTPARRTGPYVVLLGFETVAGRPPQPPGERPAARTPGRPGHPARRTGPYVVLLGFETVAGRPPQPPGGARSAARTPGRPGHRAGRTGPYVVLLGFETVAGRPPQPPGDARLTARTRSPRGRQAGRTGPYVVLLGFETVAERPPQPPGTPGRPGHRARRTASYVDTRGFETVAERPPQPPGGGEQPPHPAGVGVSSRAGWCPGGARAAGCGGSTTRWRRR
jgi:hypothetical protein